MGQEKQGLELRGFNRKTPKEAHFPRLVGKLCRLFSSPSSKRRPVDALSAASASGMPCPHQKLRKSCSASCCEQASAASSSSREHPRSSSSRASPAISEHSSLSATSSSASSCGSDRRIRFSDEVLVRDACSRGDVPSLTSLLDHLASRKSVSMRSMRHNAFGRTLLHEMAQRGSREMVEVLLRYGSDPNAPDSHGDRPLHASAARGSYEISELLLSYGAKVHLFNSDLLLPIDISRVRQDQHIVKLLSDAAHAQAAFECHQARRDAGMLGPSVRDSSARQRMRRPSVDAALQTLTKVHHEQERSTGRIYLRRMASDEPPRHRPSASAERKSTSRALPYRPLPAHLSLLARSGEVYYSGPGSVHETNPRALRTGDAGRAPSPKDRPGLTAGRLEKGDDPLQRKQQHPPLSRTLMTNLLLKDTSNGLPGDESSGHSSSTGLCSTGRIPCEISCIEL